MFETFKTQRVKTSGTEIHVTSGGSGPPLLLLHGYPQTHLMWHKVAPALAKDFTVVVPDLRGYGESGKPKTTDDHFPYSKRAMALDQVEVMAALGFNDIFSRGARSWRARIPSLGDRSFKGGEKNCCARYCADAESVR